MLMRELNLNSLHTLNKKEYRNFLRRAIGINHFLYYSRNTKILSSRLRGTIVDEFTNVQKRDIFAYEYEGKQLKAVYSASNEDQQMLRFRINGEIVELTTYFS